MADDIMTRLTEPNAGVTSDQWAVMRRTMSEAVDEIKLLKTALALAVGELSTHSQYSMWSPEMLLAQFMKEARRG